MSERAHKKQSIAYSFFLQCLLGAWYVFHHMASYRRMGGVAELRRLSARADVPAFNYRRFLWSYIQVWQTEWRSVQQGHYRASLPVRIPTPLAIIRRSLDYFTDIVDVDRRRRTCQTIDLLPFANAQNYPSYYLQNFHFQSGGWLSTDSAARYDMQVETLFLGTAAAMRRQALPFIANYLDRTPNVEIKLADLGCGTGVFLRDVLWNFPQISATAIDLSLTYLAKSREVLADFEDIHFLQANAERTCLSAESLDIVTSSFLFHELPRYARARVVSEAFRILKPGGLMILIDSLQYGDQSDLDQLLEAFPLTCHEPYFDDFCQDDLRRTFELAGFQPQDRTLCFLAKVLVFEKPISHLTTRNEADNGRGAPRLGTALP